jgi:hypothetical protein
VGGQLIAFLALFVGRMREILAEITEISKHEPQRLYQDNFANPCSGSFFYICHEIE